MKILDRMGRIYLEQGPIPTSPRNFQQGLNVALDLGDTSAQAVPMAAMGETTTCSSTATGHRDL